MTHNIPQVPVPDPKVEIIEEIKRITPVLSSQFTDIMKNIQWYSTIVVAEIAGVAKLASKSQGWIFALYILALVFLVIAIATLVFSNIRAQDIKIMIESHLTKMIADISAFNFQQSNSKTDAKDLKELLQDFYDVVQDSDPQILSKIGLFAFLIGSIFGGVGILFS